MKTNILKRLFCRHAYELQSSTSHRDVYNVPHIITVLKCTKCGKIKTEEIILKGDSDDWLH